MDRPATPPKLLSVPDVGSAHYEQNFIRLAVCELRFPTLFEVEAPPLALSKAVRKEWEVGRASPVSAAREGLHRLHIAQSMGQDALCPPSLDGRAR